LEELELISGCIQNDPQAQKLLFDRYYRKTFHVAMRYLSNHHDTEDVLSVAYTKILKSIGHFDYRGEGSLQKWVYTIVINESLRFLKNKKALFFQEEEEVLSLGIVYDQELDILDLEEVMAILEQMPKGYKTVFNLFAIEGYSHKEIAEMLQIRENTSRSQLNKARNFLILKLKKKISYEHS
jgi:RNA polymerase sigma factor (sigma-70 family)